MMDGNGKPGDPAIGAAAPVELGFNVHAVKGGRLVKVGGTLAALSLDSLRDTIMVAVLRDPRIAEASIFDPVTKRVLWGCSPGQFRVALEKGGLTPDILRGTR